MMDKEQHGKRGNPALRAGIVVVLVIIVCAVLVYVALRIIQPTPTPIGEILADMRTYDGQMVTVEGRVGSRVSILGFKSFDLTDDTGTITVVTQRGLPEGNATVTVTGVVNEVFNIGPISKTVILESAED